MATSTTNYGWTKPSYEDDADIMVLNDTIDDIDEALGAVASEIEGARGTYSTLDDRMDAQDTQINQLFFISSSGDLSSNDDLNNFFDTEGRYTSASGSITNSLLNKPSAVGYAGNLLVRHIGAAKYQIWLSEDLSKASQTTNRTGIYIRSKVGSGTVIISDWIQIV